MQNDRRLIEDWLPIADISIESLRERTPMTPFPAPNRLHVWWARRPLVASRAAVLASLLPAGTDRARFKYLLGIHGDPVAAKQRMDEAKRNVNPETGKRENLGPDPYGYKRAFTFSPDAQSLLDSNLSVLDPTAGGGSIPFEARRLGIKTVANDLNPIAWLVMKSTAEFPTLGTPLLAKFSELSRDFIGRASEELRRVFHAVENERIDGYLFARTITCPYCGGEVPLSPNWKLSSDGSGVRLKAVTGKKRHIDFEIVTKAKDHSKGTVKGGTGLCPYDDCKREIDGDEIKRQAQEGKMGDRLFAVVYKEKVSSPGKREKWERGFRSPRPEDHNIDEVKKALAEKMPLWQARNIIPDEERYIGPADRSANYGMLTHIDLFSPRQLYGHCISVEIFQDMLAEYESKGGLDELTKAAFTYVALALDKMLNYNARMVRWHANRGVVAGVFDRHDFSFKWSYAEMAPAITGLGYDWALEQTGKALRELIGLMGGEADAGRPVPAGNQGLLFSPPGDLDLREKGPRAKAPITILHGSGDALKIPDNSIDAVVMDPPYYDNVMYAELSDFFYVWLKRTVGRLYPEHFSEYLTDKDREAVANPARFKGKKQAREKAGLDYQRRMAAIFSEMRRVLKPGGIMTVMFTHKASGAWDALASGLVQAGFTITASWPVNTEAEGSLHIKEKSAAKSTIFLVCRLLDKTDQQTAYWEDVEPEVAVQVRKRIEDFQAAGISGIDLYLASFGPALEVFSSHWPLKRGVPLVKPEKWKATQGEFDPLAVKPEDALDRARLEVKKWRMDQITKVNRKGHLDLVTEFFVLAWDAFGAPKFPSDEALKLARVIGLDFDHDIKNKVALINGNNVELLDAKQRSRRGMLGAINGIMLDSLHHAAQLAREKNIGAAQKAFEKAGLIGNTDIERSLEALLQVLPPIKGSDYEYLNDLRSLCFSQIPDPRKQLILIKSDDEEDEDDEG